MTHVVEVDSGRFAVEWRSDASPCGWVRASVPAAPNVNFATRKEARDFAEERKARGKGFLKGQRQ